MTRVSQGVESPVKSPVVSQQLCDKHVYFANEAWNEENTRKSKYQMSYKLFYWGLDRTVVSVVGYFAEGAGLNPGGAKVMGTDGISKYLPP